MKSEKTRVILSFDDGRADNYRVAMKELLPRNLKATFNITTGYISGDIEKVHIPCVNPALTKDNVIELSKYKLFEIAGHGHEHLNTLEDWEKGIDILADWLGDAWKNEGGIGVASPHSEMSTNSIRELKKEFDKMNIKYVRVGLENQKKIMQRIVSKVARETCNVPMFYWPITKSLEILGNDMVVYSIPVLHAHTVRQIEYTIQKAIAKKKDIVLMFHSIVKPGEEHYDSMWSWDYFKFVELCEWLVSLRTQDKIEVTTTIEIFM